MGRKKGNAKIGIWISSVGVVAIILVIVRWINEASMILGLVILGANLSILGASISSYNQMKKLEKQGECND